MPTRDQQKEWQEWHARAKLELPARPFVFSYDPGVLARATSLPPELAQELEELLEAFQAGRRLSTYKGAPRLKPLDERPRYRGCWRIRFGFLDASELDEYRVILRPNLRKRSVVVVALGTWNQVYGR